MTSDPEPTNEAGDGPSTVPGDGASPNGPDQVVSGDLTADEAALAEAINLPLSEATVEALVADLEQAARDRDDYLGALQRNQADFENYRKRAMKQQVDAAEQAAAALIDKLLPVLDACDGAVRHGAGEVEPIFAALLGTLEKEGLSRIDPGEEPFDPTQHDAVMHEPGDGTEEGTIVVEVMRPGYGWKGRVIRPAMVKVKG